MNTQRVTAAPRWSRRILGIAQNLGLSLVAVAVTALAAEVVLRVFFSPRYHPLVPSGERGLFWEYDPDLGWRHRPGTSGRFRKPGAFDTEVTINALGFRGPEPAPVRGRDRLRVIVLGDSIVWGYGVEDGEVFTAVLQRERPGLEVINMGVSGYGTDQELLLLRREGLKLRPEIVLMEVCENDFSDILRDQAHGLYPKPRFVLSDGSLLLTNVPVPRVSAADRTLFWLETRSHLWRFIGTSRPGSASILWLKGVGRRAGLSRALPPPPAFPDEAERLLVALLEEVRRECDRAGARLVLFAVAPMPEPHRELVARFGEIAGVPVIDLTPPFAAALSRPGGPPVFLRNDLHWTAEGHRLVARTIGRWLDGPGGPRR